MINDNYKCVFQKCTRHPTRGWEDENVTHWQNLKMISKHHDQHIPQKLPHSSIVFEGFTHPIHFITCTSTFLRMYKIAFAHTKTHILTRSLNSIPLFSGIGPIDVICIWVCSECRMLSIKCYGHKMVNERNYYKFFFRTNFLIILMTFPFHFHSFVYCTYIYIIWISFDIWNV